MSELDLLSVQLEHESEKMEEGVAASLVGEAAEYVAATSPLNIRDHEAAKEIAWAFAEGLRVARGADDNSLREAARHIGFAVNGNW